MRNGYGRMLFGAASLCILMACVSGCLVSEDSDTTHSGTNVAPSTFEQIKVGSTTIGWVHATLGEPSTKTNDNGDEVWKYTYTEHTDSSGAILFVFGGTTSSDRTNTVFIEFKNGIVINKWRG